MEEEEEEEHRQTFCVVLLSCFNGVRDAIAFSILEIPYDS